MITIVCNCPISAYASSFEDVANELYLSSATMGNVFRYILEEFGVILNPSLWGTGSMNERFQEYLTEQALITDSDSYMDYLRAHLPVSEDESGEITYSADTEIVNNLYNFAVQAIEEYTPWYTYRTFDYSAYASELFVTMEQYNAFNELLKGLNDDVITLCNFVPRQWNDKFYIGVQIIKYDGLVFCDASSSYGDKSHIIPYYNWKSWSGEDVYSFGVFEDGSISKTYADYGLTPPDGKTSDDLYVKNSFPLYGMCNYEESNKAFYLCEYNNILHRVYYTVDDYKQYSLGQRPYYVTEKFTNYDSTIDNSTTITQTEIDNSVTYGDVYNYITNNYENPDGLSEDELRAILAEYLSQINNNGGSGSGSGSGSDSGSSGGGLLDFLSGLGSLGDAILSIIGKLIEYVGKAIDLIVNGISGIIEKIPQSITGLMAAAFPFLPEEFFTAIELALILGVVCIVIKIFK